MGRLPQECILDDEWGVTVNGQSIASIDEDALYRHCWGDTTVRYWQKKFSWADVVLPSIDWDLITVTFSKLTFAERRLTSKLASGILGVGANMKKWGFEDTDECPRCGQAKEDNHHALRCKDHRSQEQWDQSVSALTEQMRKLGTDDLLAHTLELAVQNARSDRSSNPRYLTGLLADAWRDQQRIGWFPLMVGFMSPAWAEAYAHGLLRRRSKGDIPQLTLRWKKAIHRKLLNVSWDMWRHRNGIKHDDETPAKRREMIHLDQLVRDQFHTGKTGLDPQFYYLLDDTPIERIFQYDRRVKQQWLESIELARDVQQRRVENQRNRLRLQRDLMANWLQSARGTDTAPEADRADNNPTT